MNTLALLSVTYCLCFIWFSLKQNNYNNKIKNVCLHLDSIRWMTPKPQQSPYHSNDISPKGCSEDVDALVRSSNLSPSAPEFVPSGSLHYEVNDQH